MDESNIKTADPANPGLLPSVTGPFPFFLHSPGYKAEIACWLAHSLIPVEITELVLAF